MKDKEEIEIAEAYFERHPMVILVSVVLSALMVGTTIYLFTYKEFEMHGWALVLIPPGLFSSFQTLLFILNPYALIFEDKMEIKRHMFSNKHWYFNDIKMVSDPKNSKITLTYNDDDTEVISLKGMKPAHMAAFKKAIEAKIIATLSKRELNLA